MRWTQTGSVSPDVFMKDMVSIRVEVSCPRRAKGDLGLGRCRENRDDVCICYMEIMPELSPFGCINMNSRFLQIHL